MKVSYKWLQEYIEEELPPVSKTVDALTMHSFEIEGVEEIEGDSILDVKILPNRSHDCLSHYGIASELASVMGLTRKELLPPVAVPDIEKIKINIETNACSRAMMVLIKDLKIGESPDWMKEKLKSLGQKPINSVVDITNYLMYSFGQPMHAFDAGKVAQDKKGNFVINIRHAKQGEKIKLLNDKEYELNKVDMVIADGEKALDVAGVMGGKESSVNLETTDVLLSFSGFNAVSVRKTSKSLGVRTDASQRFENDISHTLIDRVLPYALELVSQIAGGEVVGIIDVISTPLVQKTVKVTAKKISTILGVELNSREIIEILKRQMIDATLNNDEISVLVPHERLDMELVEDIAEEVGRLHGFENIEPRALDILPVVEINIPDRVCHMIRFILYKNGFSEIKTYSFRKEGEVEVENPIAGDKNFLRDNLVAEMSEAIEKNFKYLDLLNIGEVKLFEIGSVFTTKNETVHLCIGVKYPKSKKGANADEAVSIAIRAIEEELGVSIGNVSIVGGVAEIDIHRIVTEIKGGIDYPKALWEISKKPVVYKTISPYPFAVRDVAVFVPASVKVEVVEDLIKKHLNDNVVRLSLFDTFNKGEKTSYAFRLIFQSQEKTLTEEEINAVMNPIYETLKGEDGFEIR